MGESPPPPATDCHFEELLKTSALDVPLDYVDLLARFCADAPGVARGYLCSVRVQRWGADPEQHLRFGVELEAPVEEPPDSAKLWMAPVTDLSRTQPHLFAEVGFCVLADRAVAGWEAHALRIFPP